MEEREGERERERDTWVPCDRGGVEGEGDVQGVCCKVVGIWSLMK